VVLSHWTKDQLDRVRDHLHQRWQHWNLYALGPQHAEDGQAHITASLVRDLPEIAVGKLHPGTGRLAQGWPCSSVPADLVGDHLQEVNRGAGCLGFNDLMAVIVGFGPAR
jgi:hypothetical protein